MIEPLSADFGVTWTARDGAHLDELPTDHVKQLLARHGAIWFRGWQVDAELFDRYSSQFSPDPERHGPLAPVASGDRQLGLHCELHLEPGPLPDLVWIMCVTPSTFGGDTVLCDGIRLLAELDAETRTYFETHRLRFTATYGPHSARGWKAIFGVGDLAELPAQPFPDTSWTDLGNQLVEITHVRSAIRLEVHSGKLAFSSSALALVAHAGNSGLVTESGDQVPRAILERLLDTAERLLVVVRWTAGDVLAFDNFRLLHGRRAFGDVAEREMLQKSTRADF